MKIRSKCIAEYLQKKQSAFFSGSVKLSFERGDIVAINEANRYDLPTTKLENGEQIVADLLEDATDSDFFGTIVFVFEGGTCKEYAYSRTFKGDLLRRQIGA